MKELSEELQANIAAYLDGELPPAEAARFEIFLSNTDPELASRILAMTLDKSAVKSLPKVETPSDLSSRVMEAVERASLLHGVENMADSHQRWWQSRSAIAAAIVLMLGGFTFFVIQAVRRPDNAWNTPVALTPPGPHGEKSRDATFGLAGKAGPEPVTGPEVAMGKNGKGNTLNGTNTDNNVVFANGGGASEALLEQQLVKAQTTVNQPFADSLKNGFEGAETPQVALESVSAAPRKFVTGSPVLMTLVARDASDQQRLRSLLEAYIAQDSAVTAQQGAIYNRTIAVSNTGLVVGNDPNNNLNGNLGVGNGGMNGSNTLNGGQQQSGNYSQQIAQKQGVNSTQTTLDSNTLAMNYNQYSMRNKGFEQVDNNNNDGLRNAQRAAAASRGNFANGSATPFRVVLRPAQLAEIANTFQVHAITRGNNAYVINNQRRSQVTPNEASQREFAYGNKSVTPKDFDMTKPSMPSAVSATAPALAPIATGSATASEKALADAGINSPRVMPSTKGGAGGGSGAMSGGGKSAGASIAKEGKDFSEHDVLNATKAEVDMKSDMKSKLEKRVDEQVTAAVVNNNSSKVSDLEVLPVREAEANKAGDQWVECIISMESATPEVNASPAASQQLNGAQQINTDAILNRAAQEKASQNIGK